MTCTPNQDNHIQTIHNQETDEPTSDPTTPTPAISTAAANTEASEHHAPHSDANDALPRPRKQSDDNSNNSINVRNRREAIALDGLMFDSGSLQDLTQVQEVMRQTCPIDCQGKIWCQLPFPTTPLVHK